MTEEQFEAVVCSGETLGDETMDEDAIADMRIRQEEIAANEIEHELSDPSRDFKAKVEEWRRNQTDMSDVARNNLQMHMAYLRCIHEEYLDVSQAQMRLLGYKNALRTWTQGSYASEAIQGLNKILVGPYPVDAVDRVLYRTARHRIILEQSRLLTAISMIEERLSREVQLLKRELEEAREFHGMQ